MGAGAIKAGEKMGQDKFLRKTACTRPPFYPRTTFHAGCCQAGDNNGGNFQAIALPGLEATRDCPHEEREEGKALRRARRECRRREQVEEVGGEEYSQDDYYDNEAGDYFEQEEEQDLVDEYSESENSLESDLLDYEYHDNCSTYYDGRQVDCMCMVRGVKG